MISEQITSINQNRSEFINNINRLKDYTQVLNEIDRFFIGEWRPGTAGT